MSVRARRQVYAVAGTVLLIAALIALVVGVRAQKAAPQPPESAAGVTASASGATPPASAPATAPSSESVATPAPLGPVMDASEPLRLEIPAIDVSSAIHPMALLPDGSVEVPPLGKDSYAGWYRNSPSPGEVGPSIILGHIDSAAYGPGVFFRLGDLRQGDTISVTRADRSTAVFGVERVVQYPKSQFPALEVYGNTDHAALRLITCGGRFDPAADSYEDNIVAYASLVSSHPA